MKTGWILSLALLGAPLLGPAVMAQDAAAPGIKTNVRKVGATTYEPSVAEAAADKVKDETAADSAPVADEPQVITQNDGTAADNAAPMGDDAAPMASDEPAPADDTVTAASQDAPATMDEAASETAEMPAETTSAASTSAKADTAWEIEYSVWKAASDGGEISDYEAYLESYPEGHFAGIARSRIVRLTESETAAASEAAPIEQGSADPEADDVATMATDEVRPGEEPLTDSEEQARPAPRATIQRAGIKPDGGEPPVMRNRPAQDGMPRLSYGTPEEEGALLDRPARREIQGRLTSLGFSTLGVDGAFGPRTRSAITDWQAANGAPLSGYLSGDQIALIRRQSVQSYTDWLAAQPRRAARPRTVVRHVYHGAPPPPRNDAAAAFIFGATAGAIVGTAAARSYRPRYRYYNRPRWRRW